MRKIILGSLLIWLFAGEFAATGHSEEPNSISEPNVLAEFSIPEWPNPIVVPVQFGGEEYLFILDTGASDTLFDVSFRDKLGSIIERRTVHTSGEPMILEVFAPPKAFLGSLNLQDGGEVLCSDLGLFRKVLGIELRGIIGMTFLKRYVVQIDRDKGNLSFIKPAEGNIHDWGQEVPMTYGRGEIPLVRAKILDSIETYFLIDTGANKSGSLSRAVLEYVLLDPNIKIRETLFASLSGNAKSRECRIDSFYLGPFEYKDLLFSEHYRQCLLGCSFWSRHIVTFDFPNSKLYLKKGRDFDRFDEGDMSGLHIWRNGDDIVVHVLDPNTPAEKAGIEADDVILDVMDKKATSYALDELRLLLCSQDKRQIRMTIKRGDDVLKVSFLLDKRI